MKKSKPTRSPRRVAADLDRALAENKRLHDDRMKRERAAVLNADKAVLGAFVRAVRSSKLPAGCILVGAFVDEHGAMSQSAITIADLQKVAEAIARVALDGPS